MEIVDIEDFVTGIKRNTNIANKSFGLVYDQKHEIMMDMIIEQYHIGTIKNSDDLKEYITRFTKEIRPKIYPKYGYFNYYYDQGIKIGKYKNDNVLKSILKCNTMRENSGVMVFSIFTSPYPKIKTENIMVRDDGSIDIDFEEKYVFEDKKFSCKFDCAYCPNEPGQPRSYLKSEPGVARALQNNYDPIKQFLNRAKQYINVGQSIDKCEVIIQGGTWDSYPIEYRQQFIRDIYYVANNFYNILSFENNLIDSNKFINIDQMLTQYRAQNIPNHLVFEIKNNELSLVRIIGLTPETRPDQVTSQTLIELRNIGATRLQLGIQHINDKILKYVKRNCYTQDTFRAIKLLKDNGFKVDGHFMPDLPNPNNELDMELEDKKMFEAINNDPNLKLDQIKIYPCVTTPYTKIEEWYKSGKYKPYGSDIDKPINYKFMNENEKINFRMKNPLYKNIADFCKNVHPSIRINRIIRDIPSTLIIGGTKNGSMRSQIELDLEQLMDKCTCIRCRECQNSSNKKKILDDVSLKILPFESSGGLEFFISFESNGSNYKTSVIHSFLRLRLSKDSGLNYITGETIFPELVNTALIREVHSYGKVQEHYVKSSNNSSQHLGYGKRLIKVAEEIAYFYGYKRIAVISGVGVREYYRKLGYNDSDLGCYQIKKLNKNMTINNYLFNDTYMMIMKHYEKYNVNTYDYTLYIYVMIVLLTFLIYLFIDLNLILKFL